MIKLKTNDTTGLIEIQTMTEYDYSDGQCPSMPNVMVYEINPGYKLTQMEMDFTSLKAQFETIKFDMEQLLEREKKEAKLREDYPTLQDIWEQYHMVKNLVEDGKKPMPNKDDD